MKICLHKIIIFIKFCRKSQQKTPIFCFFRVVFSHVTVIICRRANEDFYVLQYGISYTVLILITANSLPSRQRAACDLHRCDSTSLQTTQGCGWVIRMWERLNLRGSRISSQFLPCKFTPSEGDTTTVEAGTSSVAQGQVIHLEERLLWLIASPVLLSG